MSDSASEHGGRIFISYRRQDSAYPAGWLYDRLADRFGPEQIFKDVDSIELGDDFVTTITNAVGSCDILLALIGQQWVDVASADGRRRLDDPDDFVRLEVEAALEREVLLIPILVDGATMPRGDQLPPSIAPMVRRQALELSPHRFKADTERLLDVMERTLADLQDDQDAQREEPTAAAPVVPPAEPVAPEAEGPPRSRRMLLAGAALAAVVVAGVVLAFTLFDGDPKKKANGNDPSPSASATAPPKLGGENAPVVLAHRGGDEQFAWNTVPAFEHAASIGAAVETDVRWSKDGFPVIVHDENTVPGMQCEGGGFIVEDTDWEVMRDGCQSPPAPKDGKQFPIPLLDQAVAAVAKIPDAELYAEVKVRQTPRQARQFVTTIQSVRMTGRTVVTSFLPRELGKIAEEARSQGIDDLRLMQFVSGEQVPPAGLVDDLWGVAVNFTIADEAYVEDLKAADLTVMVYNINAEQDWADAVQMGADVVMTDRPAEFGEWAEAELS